MTNTIKLKLSKFANIMFYIIIGGAIAIASFIAIGSELGYAPALALKNWLEVNYGIAVSAGSIAAIAAVGKLVLSIKNNNDATVTAVSAAVEQIAATKQEIIASNEQTQAKIDEAMATFNQSIITMQSQPEQINQLAQNSNLTVEQNKIIFDLLDTFMYESTNNQRIKDICLKYKESKLWNESVSMEKFIDIVAEKAPALIEKGKEILANPQTKEVVKKVIDTATGIIKEVRR